jgi:predicted TIM-barrel fold metal-dependent hydrolase
MDASDERYRKFYEKMRDLGLVLTSHTGYEHSLKTVDQSLGDPERLRLPLEVGLKVVAGHAGTSGFYHRVEYFPNLVKMIERYEDLYADTSAILNPVRAPYRKRLLAEPVVDRLIQGTDFPVPPLPILWPVALGPAEAIRFQRVKNWFDRDILAKKAAGFPEEHFRRGHDVFLAGARTT